MGLPFASIPLNPLFESFIKCHIHAAKTRKGIYFKHLAEILHHAFIRPALVNDLNSPINLTTTLLNSQHIFYTEKDLELLFEDCKFGKYFIAIFKKADSPAELADNCLGLCSLIQTIYLHDKPGEANSTQHTNLLNEFVYHYALLFNTILKNIQKYPDAVQVSTFQSLYRSTIRQNNFPFFGEPLKGLQIMGMLETRNLDFKNIIMLNVNEDVIPRGKSNPGFIPYDVRKEFGLPTHHEGQAVSAYHFYRFLQRPENIHLIYNNEPGVINPGGKSRYLLQITRELPAWNPEIIIRDQVLRTSVAESTPDLTYRIPKTEAVMDRILNLARKGLSATALNTFRQCQMRFYFSKVLMLNEPEDPAEEIDARTFGNILHEVLEKVYANEQGQILSEELLQKIKPGIPDFIAQSFVHYFPQGDTSTGKTHLSLEVSRALLNRFLLMEKNRIHEAKELNQVFTIHGLEKEFVSDLSTETGNTVKLYGKIDRIDQSGSEIYLFDYKTGFIKDGELSLKNWDDLYSGLHFDKIFQLLFYAVLYELQDFKHTSIHTGIISFRQLSKGVQYLQLPDGICNKDAVNTHFKPYLYSLIDNLLDPAIEITQTNETELCEKCPFSAICYRDSAGIH
jgi:CRISPR/Cas system-associated exonuclease Cas4 (RecB family)